MGQAESRPITGDANQVAAEALDAFQRHNNDQATHKQTKQCSNSISSHKQVRSENRGSSSKQTATKPIRRRPKPSLATREVNLQGCECLTLSCCEYNHYVAMPRFVDKQHEQLHHKERYSDDCCPACCNSSFDWTLQRSADSTLDCLVANSNDWRPDRAVDLFRIRPEFMLNNRSVSAMLLDEVRSSDSAPRADKPDVDVSVTGGHISDGANRFEPQADEERVSGADDQLLSVKERRRRYLARSARAIESATATTVDSNGNLGRKGDLCVSFNFVRDNHLASPTPAPTPTSGLLSPLRQSPVAPVTSVAPAASSPKQQCAGLNSQGQLYDSISTIPAGTEANTLAVQQPASSQFTGADSIEINNVDDQLLADQAPNNIPNDEKDAINFHDNNQKNSETFDNRIEPVESRTSPPESVIKTSTVSTKISQKSSIEKSDPNSQSLAANLNGRQTKEALNSDHKHEELSGKTYLVWNDLAYNYGRMSRSKSDQENLARFSRDRAQSRRDSCVKSSCFFHIFCALIRIVFPIFDSLRNYSLPGDLATDLVAGFTVAVLHIPQGMAYGLLSGVEPIYGLYVSFVPVLVMSFMSRSRHVSYGTFAVISMLLVNTIESVRTNLASRELFAVNVSESGATKSLPLVLRDNHQVSITQQQRQQQMDNGKQLQLDQSDGLLADTGSLQESFIMSSSANFLLEPPTNIEILACACLVCGLIHITMCLLRLGVLSLMFSDQLVSSFTTASAVHVLTSQLAGLFDLSLAPIHEELFKIVRIWWRFGQAILFDSFNQVTAALSLLSIMFLLLIKQLVEPALKRRFRRLTCLPSELALMAVVIFCSWYFKLAAHYNVKIIGHIPTGLPEPKVPRLELVPYVLKDSLTVALISFAMNLSIGQVYAKRFRYELNANQELFALGSANIIGSFFSCFPCASSLSRSSVQSSLNVKSQICSLFSCAIVVLIICFFAHILHDLPRSTLSCIIVVALKGILFQVRDLYDNWRLSKLDATVWILTFLSVIIFGVTYGLILGIVASLFMIFLRLLTPDHSILGRLPNTEIYVDVDAFRGCEELDRVKIFRFNSALCYLNRTQLRSKIEKLFPSIFKPRGFGAICAQLHQSSAELVDHDIANGTPQIRFLIIDCSALSYCDYSGAATLIELIEHLEGEKVAVYLAACPLKLIDMLERMEATSMVLAKNVYPTISDAIGQVRCLLSAESRPTEDSEKANKASRHKDEPKDSSILDVP